MHRERILTKSISDKEQLKEPFHLKKLSYRRAGRILLCLHCKEMAESEYKAIFQTHLLFVKELNFQVIWEAIRSSGTTKHQVLIMLPLNCQKQKEYTISFSWCRGLKKNSKGAEAGGQTAVKGRSQRGLLISSVYSVLMLIYFFFYHIHFTEKYRYMFWKNMSSCELTAFIF